MGSGGFSHYTPEAPDVSNSPIANTLNLREVYFIRFPPDYASPDC
jgi:hypothetical protein